MGSLIVEGLGQGGTGMNPMMSLNNKRETRYYLIAQRHWIGSRQDGYKCLPSKDTHCLHDWLESSMARTREARETDIETKWATLNHHSRKRQGAPRLAFKDLHHQSGLLNSISTLNFLTVLASLASVFF